MKMEPMSTEALRAIYTALYEQNLCVVREDYLDIFQSKFAPSVALAPDADVESLIGSLDALMEDLYDNLRDDDELKRRFLAAGGPEDLFNAIAYSNQPRKGE